MGVFSGIITGWLKPYIDAWKKQIASAWSVNAEMAYKGAILFLLLHLYGYKPQITSGYRSIEKQKELYDRWLAGDKTIHTPALPGTSPHQKKIALDIWCTDPKSAAWIAHQIGLKTGFEFNDPVHFQLSA